MTAGQPLRVYNSLGRREDKITATGTLSMYTCGPTVYAYPHLGNMRAYVFSDTVRRALRWKDVPTRHIINITDVGHAVADTDQGQDKLEAAAEREHRAVTDIAAHYTRAFLHDTAALNILPAHAYPRATDYIDEMIEFAARLEEHGYAYQLDSGLYFDTTKLPDYGKLAQIDVEGQAEGARVEVVPGRRRKTDFALWRAERPGEQRLMRWTSPWGWGAPGWHLECSVMSIAHLGPHFDIHTGGVDHRELHHVNEIAQSQAWLDDDRPWVRYWLHNEFLQLNAEKMAKSAGTAPRLVDLTDAGYHPIAFRLFLLTGHYRSQLDFTHRGLDAAQSTLRRMADRIQAIQPLPEVDTYESAAQLLADEPAATSLLNKIDAAISADLHTPKVVALLHEAQRNTEITPKAQAVLIAAGNTILGLDLANLTPNKLDIHEPARRFTTEQIRTIEHLIDQRTQAREQRNWARADQIREELANLGVYVTDAPTGTVWRQQQADNAQQSS